MDLISVIVPVYNSSQYICDCVASVLEQTYPYFEVLLVDDGSQDNSRDVCRKQCAKDKRIRCICREHKGVSAARNAGIEAAQGTYLFFLDSDDIIHPRLLEVLYGLMKETGAAVGTQMRYRVTDGVFKKPGEWETAAPDRLKSSYLENEKALECRVFASPKTALSGIGGKMILSSAAGKIRFDETLTHAEDTLFMYRILAGGADVAVLHSNWYCYRIHENGTFHQLSAKGCNSIYNAECHIRDQEMESGRAGNAEAWELAILNTVLEWYRMGWENGDSELMKYAISRVDIEKKREIFSRICRMKRWEVRLLAYCYPFRKAYFLYIFIIRVMYFLHYHVTLPRICYRKVLNLIHIHRWRVRWAYKNVKWKAVFAGQMIWIAARRIIRKVMDIRHMLFKRRSHTDGE